MLRESQSSQHLCASVAGSSMKPPRGLMELLLCVHPALGTLLPAPCESSWQELSPAAWRQAAPEVSRSRKGRTFSNITQVGGSRHPRPLTTRTPPVFPKLLSL